MENGTRPFARVKGNHASAVVAVENSHLRTINCLDGDRLAVKIYVFLIRAVMDKHLVDAACCRIDGILDGAVWITRCA